MSTKGEGKWPEMKVARFPDYPGHTWEISDEAARVYAQSQPDVEVETMVPKSRLSELEEKLKRLEEAVDFEVGCMEDYAEEKGGMLGKLAREMAEPIRAALDSTQQQSTTGKEGCDG